MGLAVLLHQKYSLLSEFVLLFSVVFECGLDLLLFVTESQDSTIWRDTESQAACAQIAEGWEGSCKWKKNFLHPIYSHIKRNHVPAVSERKGKEHGRRDSLLPGVP